MNTPKAHLHQGEFLAAIENAVKDLGPEVVDVTPSLREDADGDPAVYLQVTLRDADSRGDALRSAMHRVQDRIYERVDPLAEWGVRPYFRYRNETERDQKEQLSRA